MTDLNFSHRAGYPCWSVSAEGGLEARFVGRGRDGDRDRVLETVEPEHGLAAVSWARQIHSARWLQAEPGCVDEGDALHSQRSGLPLCVTTADCVPVVFATERRIAAVHAGWRGLAAKLPRFAATELARDATPVSAWIGPAIGRCCYEVGNEVATAVAAASTETAIERDGREKPHLDLVAATVAQLDAAGVNSLSAVATCTRCNPELLWSYRRDGRNAGRNLAFVWRRL